MASELFAFYMKKWIWKIIFESTVKTYMKRICDKLEVPGRSKLFQQLSRQEQLHSSHANPTSKPKINLQVD